jgi:phosphoribosylaminoimidazole carboxylase (NCAIR synthetase)
MCVVPVPYKQVHASHYQKLPSCIFHRYYSVHMREERKVLHLTLRCGKSPICIQSESKFHDSLEENAKLHNYIIFIYIV